MAPAVTPGGEVIIICIDNTTRILDYHRAQLEASYQIQSQLRTVVGLSTMSQTPYYGYLGRTLNLALKPTRDLGKILDTLQHIKCGGEMGFVETIIIEGSPENAKTDSCVSGGDINVSLQSITDYANPLKEDGIAVDVVNFTLGDIHGFRYQMLEAFVEAVNNNHNSRIIHITF